MYRGPWAFAASLFLSGVEVITKRRDKLGLAILAICTLVVASIAGDGKRDDRQTLLDDFRRADVPAAVSK